MSVPHERREASICVETLEWFPGLLAKPLRMISIRLTFTFIDVHDMHAQVCAKPGLFVLWALGSGVCSRTHVTTVMYVWVSAGLREVHTKSNYLSNAFVETYLTKGQYIDYLITPPRIQCVFGKTGQRN